MNVSRRSDKFCSRGLCLDFRAVSASVISQSPEVQGGDTVDKDTLSKKQKKQLLDKKGRTADIYKLDIYRITPRKASKSVCY